MLLSCSYESVSIFWRNLNFLNGFTLNFESFMQDSSLKKVIYLTDPGNSNKIHHFFILTALLSIHY